MVDGKPFSKVGRKGGVSVAPTALAFFDSVSPRLTPWAKFRAAGAGGIGKVKELE